MEAAKGNSACLSFVDQGVYCWVLYGVYGGVLVEAVVVGVWDYVEVLVNVPILLRGMKSLYTYLYTLQHALALV